MTVRTRGSTVDSLGDLLSWPREEMGGLWRSSLAHHLGELGEELALADIAGLVAQVTSDAPHFAASARRLPAIDEHAQREVARLRREVVDQHGSKTSARDVSSAVEALLLRVRTLHRLSSDLMLDAYSRDIGGD